MKNTVDLYELYNLELETDEVLRSVWLTQQGAENLNKQRKEGSDPCRWILVVTNGQTVRENHGKHQ